jgi:hypothetical protein
MVVHPGGGSPLFFPRENDFPGSTPSETVSDASRRSVTTCDLDALIVTSTILDNRNAAFPRSERGVFLLIAADLMDKNESQMNAKGGGGSAGDSREGPNAL